MIPVFVTFYVLCPAVEKKHAVPCILWILYEFVKKKIFLWKHFTVNERKESHWWCYDNAKNYGSS